MPYKFTKTKSDRRILKVYGISDEDYCRMLAAQNGKCVVCGRENSGYVKNGEYTRMYVDHDHATGKIRGLLCRTCNSAIGFAQDNPEILEKLSKYLRGE